MPGCSIITYKGKEILYLDHRGLKNQDIISNFKLGDKMIREYKGEVLVLANFTDTFANDEALAHLKSKEARDGDKKLKKGSVVGITSIKKIFLNVINAIGGGKYKAFDNEEDAKEYLVKD